MVSNAKNILIHNKIIKKRKMNIKRQHKPYLITNASHQCGEERRETIDVPL